MGDARGVVGRAHHRGVSVKTFECRYCHAVNTVPETLDEAHGYDREGYIRLGRTTVRVPRVTPIPCCGAHAQPRTFVPQGMETKAAGECGPECDAGDCGCSNG
jgi:hypothetical protein